MKSLDFSTVAATPKLLHEARLDDNPRFVAMAADEEFVLTLTEDGMGKRTSAYEYRIAGRGGQGVTGIDLGRGKGKTSRIIAAFTVIDADQIVLVSDGGQIIRCPIDQISVVGRTSRGVTVFDTAEDERVVSVSRLRDVDDDDDGNGDVRDYEEGEAGTEDSSGSEGDDGVEPPSQGEPS